MPKVTKRNNIFELRLNINSLSEMCIKFALDFILFGNISYLAGYIHEE